MNNQLKPFYLKINNTDQEMEVLQVAVDFTNRLDLIDISEKIKLLINFDISDFESLIFCTDEMAKNIAKINDFCKFDYTLKQADDMLFYNQIDLNKADKTFKTIVNQWIVDNYSVNDVLDKKLEGIEFNEADLLILQNH